MSTTDGTSYIRIRETARSTFRGVMLRLIRKERRKGSAVFDYLCEMPGWSRPGWFSHDEVDDAFGREGTSQEGQPSDTCEHDWRYDADESQGPWTGYIEKCAKCGALQQVPA